MKILYKEKEVSVIDLGTVKIGESKTYKYTLENDSKWELKNITFSLQNVDGQVVKEIEFIDPPTVMTGRSRSTLEFKWTPGIEIKQGLKTQLQINALEIWN